MSVLHWFAEQVTLLLEGIAFMDVYVFDKVLRQPPQNPRAIDVYIDNTYQQRVRW